jgi:glycosyltransferase involved in cell wall biosynthesis
MKARVFIFTDWYMPGFKAGGLVTAVSNLVDSVGMSYDLFIFTRDRDITDRKPYPNVQPDKWVSVGKARVFYTADLSLSHIRRRIFEISPDIIYLNSFYSRLTVATLLLRRLGLLPFAAVVLAPRGELSPGALELKRWRKSLYRAAARAVGLCRGAVWQASSPREELEIRSVVARGGSVSDGNIQLASDIPNPRLFLQPTLELRPTKFPGSLRLVFLSRVSRMKNLRFALELLESAHGEIQLDIYGPIVDEGYWNECAKQIRRLPNSIRVSYQKPVAQDQVLEVFAKYHFQLLPTLGENFGYTILEGLAVGCPVIMSDRTPWLEVTDGGAGWSVALEDRDLWRQVLQQCVEMDQSEYAEYSRRARGCLEAWARSHDQKDETVRLFNFALERGASLRREPGCVDAA